MTVWYEPGMPCRQCGAARSCEHREVDPPVAGREDFYKVPRTVERPKKNLGYSYSKRYAPRG